MFKEIVRHDGFYAQFLRTPKVLDVMCHDEAAAGGDRAFEDHVVVRVAQEGAPEIVDILQARQRSQIAQKTQHLRIADPRRAMFRPPQYRLPLHFVFLWRVRKDSNLRPPGY